MPFDKLKEPVSIEPEEVRDALEVLLADKENASEALSRHIAELQSKFKTNESILRDLLQRGL